MKIIIILVFFFVIRPVTIGQNLIGFRNDEIIKFMKENCMDMNFVKVNNSKFTYLKYSNNSDNQTLLFFLTPDSVCKSVRIICDEGAKSDKLKEFNTQYKISGNNRWIDSRDGKDYLIEIKDDKWTSIITIEPFK